MTGISGIFEKEENSDTVLPLGVAGGALIFGENAAQAVGNALSEETESEMEAETETLSGGPLTVLLENYIKLPGSTGQFPSRIWKAEKYTDTAIRTLCSRPVL